MSAEMVSKITEKILRKSGVAVQAPEPGLPFRVHGLHPLQVREDGRILSVAAYVVLEYDRRAQGDSAYGRRQRKLKVLAGGC